MAIAGDILQFKGHVVTTTVTTKTTHSDGTVETADRVSVRERPHHTAVVLANKGVNGLEIIEQNREKGHPVELDTLLLKGKVTPLPPKHRNERGADLKLHPVTIVETITVRITPRVRAYRPLPEKKHP